MIEADWISPQRTGLVLIDCQVDFGAPEGEMARRGADIAAAQAAVAQAELLAEAARAAGAPLVFVRLLTHPGGETPVLREAKQRRGDDQADPCREGTHGADFIGPQPQDEDIIVSKTRFDAFAHTGLAERLHGQGIDTLVLAGLTTECCVQSSAWSAFEQDFHVFIVEDACAAYEPALHRHALKSLKLSGAVVTTTSEVTALWKSKQ